jgi:EmrB/QacA subfamily drug resistance transporter
LTSGTADPPGRDEVLERYGLPTDTTPKVRALFVRYGASYRWFVVSTVMLGSLAMLLTSTIINVAIPVVMGAFGIGQEKAQWLSAGFLAATTTTMLVSSWMIASIGMRATYLLGMGVFALGSVLGGVSMNADSMIFARIVQGASSGMIGPLSLLILFQVFPVERRGSAMGIFGVGVVLAPALGPTLGGVLIDHFSWRSVFFMAVPVCAMSLPLAAVFLPGRETSGPLAGFDWPGLVLMSAFVMSLLLGLSNGQAEGWSSDLILTYFAVAGASSIAFLVWESSCREPMLDLGLFRHRGFSAAGVVTFVFGAGLFGSTFLVPIFLQTLQGMTATRSGLLLMPAGLILAVVFPIAGYLSDRISSHLLILSGLFLFAVSSYLLGGLDINTPYWTLIWWIIVGRIGLGLVMPSLTRSAMTAVPFALLAQAASVMNFLRQLGGAFGVNLLSIQVEQRTALYGDALAVQQSLENAGTMELVHQLHGMLAQAGIPEAYQLPGALLFLGRVIYSQAMILAFRDGFLIVAAVFLLTLIPAWFMPDIRAESPAAGEPA